MGTALTERHVRELSRLTRRVYLCFDGDAAGAEATLRGMELATAAGLDVRVVSLPPGVDPADQPEGFEERLAGASSYVVHRVRVELERSTDRQEAFVRAREVLANYEESPERQEALRLVTDRLGLPKETQAGLAPAARGRGPRPEVSPRLLTANDRLERDALAGVVAHPELVRVLGELGVEHFDVELHRRTVAHLLEPGEPDAELVVLLAELDARAEQEAIDAATAEQLLLRLRERKLKRELETAGEDRLPDLQQALAKVRTRFREFA
jgi:DNA primase